MPLAPRTANRIVSNAKVWSTSASLLVRTAVDAGAFCALIIACALPLPSTAREDALEILDSSSDFTGGVFAFFDSDDASSSDVALLAG